MIILMGNGVNNVSSEYNWQNLIEDLIEFIGAGGQIDINHKPFPLLYEEIFLEAVRYRGARERKIKKFIAEKVSEIPDNEIHKKLLELDCNEFLTTNYDYSLEKVLTSNLSGLRNEGKIKENVFSLFRHNRIGQKRIWHIHGESSIPASISLGYEHYAGYLQQMRNYVVTGTGKTYKNIVFDPLMKRFLENKIQFDSWIDFFFTDNIYIIGFTMDFVEIHLWWLLTYRARRKFEKKMPINNKIVYFFPDKYCKLIKNKIDLLRSNDVVPYSIKLNKSWKNYYLRILEKLESHDIFE